jgi:hypothetical protein
MRNWKKLEAKQDPTHAFCEVQPIASPVWG